MTVGGIVNRKVTLPLCFKEDNVAALKHKVTLATGIPQYRQHLRTTGSKGRPLYYRIYDENGHEVSVDIHEIAEFSGKLRLSIKSIALVQDLPIDMHMYDIRDSFTIEALDDFQLLGELPDSDAGFELYDLDEYIGDNLSSLRALASSDEQQIRMIYFGFIVKYWPMIATFDVFLTMLRGEMDVYPELKNNRALDAEIKLMARQAEFWNTPPKEVEMRSQLIDTNIKSATVHVSAKPPVIGRGNRLPRILSPLNLFNNVKCNSSIPITRLQSRMKNKTVIFTRVLTTPVKTPGAGVTLNINSLYENVKSRIMPSPIWYIEQMLIVVMHEDPLVLAIRDDGTYQIRTSWGEESHVDYEELLSILQKHVSPIINRINAMGRSIFTGRSKLPELSSRHSRFSGLHLCVTYKHPVNSTVIANLKTLLKEYMNAGIISSAVNEDKVSSQFGSYYFKKGVNDMERYEMTIASTPGNQYTYLTDVKQRARWPKSERYMTFSSQAATSLRVDVYDLREEEFGAFHQFVIFLLYLATANEKKTKIVEVKPSGIFTTLDDLKKISPLKLLRSRDPELYSFNKKYGTALVYSRICQKEHQPIIFDQREYEALDPSLRAKAVKYWNFTTHEPAWYLCPNAKFPYLSFIVGQHPQGYCIPCCKKTPPREIIGKSKRANIYEICMRDHVYNEQSAATFNATSNTRYIMNYGKIIDVGRIGQLPDILLRYIQYNKTTTELVVTPTIAPNEVSIIEYDGHKYDADKLRAIAIKHRVRNVPVSVLRKYMAIVGFLENVPAVPPNKPVIPIMDELLLYESVQVRVANISDDERPVVLYDPDIIDKFVLLTGIYAVAAAVEKKRTEIESYVITKTQMAKAMIKSTVDESDQKTGGDCGCCNNIYGGDMVDDTSFHHNNYYLYGVQQHNANLSDIGAVYSIVAALGISLFEMCEQILQVLRPDHFIFLYRGLLPQYFKNYEYFRDSIRAIMNDEMIDSPPFPYWNELFIEFTEVFFRHQVYIMTEVGDVDRMILNRRDFRDVYYLTYILLWRIAKKERSLFGVDYIYYPIFKLQPLAYFKTSHITYRIFTDADVLTMLIKKAASEQNDNTLAEKELAHCIATINLRVQNPNIIFRTTCEDLIYAIEFDGIFWPLRYVADRISPFKKLSDYAGKTKLAPAGKVATLINQYNRYAMNTAVDNGQWTHGYKSEENVTEDDVIPHVPYIKVDKFIMYNNAICGMIDSRGISWFFEPTTDGKTLLQDVRNILPSDFRTRPANKTIWYMKYDKNEVDLAINTTDSQPLAPHEVNLAAAYYDRYLYDLFVIELFNWLPADELRTWFTLTPAALMRTIAATCKRSGLFINGKPPIGSDFPFVFTPCANHAGPQQDCPQCARGKLIVPNDRMADLQKLLCEDLSNPLKREQLASAVILANARNQFGIVRRIGEEVYVRYA